MCTYLNSYPWMKKRKKKLGVFIRNWLATKCSSRPQLQYPQLRYIRSHTILIWVQKKPQVKLFLYIFLPSYTIFYHQLHYFFLFPPSWAFFPLLDALNMNPQAERSSRSSRGKVLKRKVSQEPQKIRSSRFSRASPQDPQDPQDKRFSRGFSRWVSLYCCRLVQVNLC